ncbi:MAG: hypothetical protein GY797_38725 [Deltaproteobacteria bacterium]|nr:hypothetical protein [Deltaproteobacteria bacterium]
MKKVKAICWYCKKSQVLELKAPEKYRGNDQEYYICPSCNAANSPVRIDEDIKSGKAKRML